MTSSPGLCGWSRLQSNCSPPWSVTDDDKRRRQTQESKTILAPTLCVGGPVMTTPKRSEIDVSVSADCRVSLFWVEITWKIDNTPGGELRLHGWSISRRGNFHRRSSVTIHTNGSWPPRRTARPVPRASDHEPYRALVANDHVQRWTDDATWGRTGWFLWRYIIRGIIIMASCTTNNSSWTEVIRQGSQGSSGTPIGM